MILCGLCNARGKKCKRNNASFVSPIAWSSKTRERSSKITDFFKKNNGHFFKNDGHFFSIFREEERRKRKNGGLKRDEKKKNLIRYFANH